MNRPIARRLLLAVAMVALLVGAVSASAANDPARVFRAGADRADITPELGTMIVGALRPDPANEIHDLLSARTLVLDDGAIRIAFVVCDHVGLSQAIVEEAKRQITQHTGMPKTHVLISSTHTHSGGAAGAMRERGGSAEEPVRDGSIGPSTRLNPYATFIARRISDSVRNAIARLEPAKIGWGVAHEPGQVFNRRWHVKSEENRRNPFGGVDTVRMNPGNTPEDLIKPAGPTDPEICFVSVQTADGRPLALLANYSLHYVGQIPPGVISADYFAAFATRIGQLLGADRQDPPFVGIMSNGTSGDINNINFRARATLPPFEQINRVANIVAGEVYRAYQSIQHKDWVRLDVRYDELALEPRRLSPEVQAYVKKNLDRPAGEKPWHHNERAFFQLALAMEDPSGKLRVPVQAFRIGDLAIAATAVETLVEVGLEIKEKAPFKKAFTISIANGSFGYMPTVAQHKLGGYETWIGVNRIEPEAAPKMVTRLLAMMEEMNR